MTTEPIQWAGIQCSDIQGKETGFHKTSATLQGLSRFGPGCPVLLNIMCNNMCPICVYYAYYCTTVLLITYTHLKWTRSFSTWCQPEVAGLFQTLQAMWHVLCVLAICHISFYSEFFLLWCIASPFYCVCVFCFLGGYTYTEIQP